MSIANYLLLHVNTVACIVAIVDRRTISDLSVDVPI